MGILEKHITKKTKVFLDSLTVIWYWKVSDRFTSGVPDIVGVYMGRFFAIELKKPGKKASLLQAWTLKNIEEAGGKTLSTSKIEDVIEFMDSFPTHS